MFYFLNTYILEILAKQSFHTIIHVTYFLLSIAVNKMTMKNDQTSSD